MNLISILLCLLLWTDNDNAAACDAFYKKEFDHLAIDGKVMKKEMGEQYYVIVVLNKDKKEVKFRLLKNMAGFEIYNFILPGSYILKQKGKRDIP